MSEPLREHPVHELLKHVREAESHLHVRCRDHVNLALAKRPDELYAVLQHLHEIERLAKDVMPWEREAREREAIR